MKDWREFSIREELEARELAWAKAAREESYRAGQEMSGAAVPWLARYFPELAHGGTEYHRRKRGDRETDVSAMLAAQEFQRLWDRAMATLANVEQRVDDLMITVDQDLAEAEGALADIQSRAETLGDGTRIYPDREGNWRTEDGRVVDLEEAGLTEEGQPGMPGIPRPTWEEFAAARDRVQALEQVDRELEAYRYRAGEIRHNAEDAKDRGDLRALEREWDKAEKLRQEVEDVVNNASMSSPELRASPTQVTHASTASFSSDLNQFVF